MPSTGSPNLIRTSPADVFVSQAGVRTMHMSASTLPADTPARGSRSRLLPGQWPDHAAGNGHGHAGPRRRLLHRRQQHHQHHVFVDLTEFARIHGDRVSYVLAGLDDEADPETVADAIQTEAAGALEAQTREEFADSEARVVTDMSADLLRLRSTIGLVIALAVIALGLMTATLNRLRDFAVLKGPRRPHPRLAGAVAMQVC